ncbi:MAG: 3-deoxy-7-phosphoheptulonate synthase [Nitrospiraceae bacterium]|nr:3-deoxy-7-phosphoheptulonate synthase [Nitrospiraceae bacterium]
MILILKPDVTTQGPTFEKINNYLKQFPKVKTNLVELEGETRKVMEIHLIGPTHDISEKVLLAMPGIEQLIRVSNKYRQIGRYDIDLVPVGFTYQGLKFDQDSFHIFAGPCAVDTPEYAERVFKCLKRLGITTTRMGAYKPRTSPYDFQGHGAKCLPWVFELAGKYGIKIIAMEVLREQHIEEIRSALEDAGNPTGIMLQVGTRNAQNFELLKAIGSQKEFPVLYKRGMGLTLEESLNACEYIVSEGNRRIIFCLRGVKTQLGSPHRNLVDFVHVPVIKRLTRLPVCVDPSHSIGSKVRASDGILEISHAAAQGVIAGANMILLECHPEPEAALCDSQQLLTPAELEQFINDMALVRETYKKRISIYS